MGVDTRILHLVLDVLPDVVHIFRFGKQVFIKILVDVVVLGCFFVNKTPREQEHFFVLELVGIVYLLVKQRVLMLQAFKGGNPVKDQVRHIVKISAVVFGNGFQHLGFGKIVGNVELSEGNPFFVAHLVIFGIGKASAVYVHEIGAVPVKISLVPIEEPKGFYLGLFGGIENGVERKQFGIVEIRTFPSKVKIGRREAQQIVYLLVIANTCGFVNTEWANKVLDVAGGVITNAV